MFDRRFELIFVLVLGVLAGLFASFSIIELNSHDKFDVLQHELIGVKFDLSYYKQRNIDLVLALQAKNVTYVDRFYVGQFSGRDTTSVYVELYNDSDASKAIQWALDHHMWGMVEISDSYINLSKEPIIISK